MKTLDYKDISIVPRVISTLEHRSEAQTTVDFCGLNLEVPVIGAPMPDVCNGTMAYHLRNNGCLGIIHRFQTIEEQCKEFIVDSHGDSACAIGVTGDWKERIDTLFGYGCIRFCLDTANGANRQVEKVVYYLKDKSDYGKDCYVICGNVASYECFKYLQELGVDAIRCGIAGGSVCETKTETGCFHPMFSMLQEIHLNTEFPRPKIIADGGIKSPADICKALIFADVVMIGGLLAATKESPSQTLKLDGKVFKVLRGAASFSVQQEFKDEPKYIEGRETLIPYGGHVSDLCRRIRYGLESSMSYNDSRTLEEFKRKVRWVEV